MNNYFQIWADCYNNHLEIHGWLFGNWVEINFEFNYDGYQALKEHWEWVKRAYKQYPDIKPPYTPTPKYGLDDIPF